MAGEGQGARRLPSSDHSSLPEGFASRGSGWWTGARIRAGEDEGRQWWQCGLLSLRAALGRSAVTLLGFLSQAVAAASRKRPALVFLLPAFGGERVLLRANGKGLGKSLCEAPRWLPPFPSSCRRTAGGMRNQLPVLTPSPALPPFPPLTNPRIIQLKKMLKGSSPRRSGAGGGGGGMQRTFFWQ